MPNWRQIIIWNNAGPIHWRIHAALERIELMLNILSVMSQITSKTPADDQATQGVQGINSNCKVLFSAEFKVDPY